MTAARNAVAIALAGLGIGLVCVPAARAEGDPIMPLGDVKAGMRCTAYTVVRGTDITSFQAEVLEIVEGSPGYAPRIMVEVSGPAVDGTGIGPGFSGSPIYCPGGDGVMRNAGAISESVGSFGGKVVLATPIEAILGEVGDPPGETKPPTGTRAAEATAPARAPRTVHGRHVLAINAPLTVAGLSPPLGRALTAAGAKRGRLILTAPTGPAARYQPRRLRPGSAFGVGVSTGDLTIGATGTVAYVDGDQVWGFGHPYEGLGKRGLLLQDAYVYGVINNPNQSEAGTTYKLAASGHDIGTLTNDALEAVVGRMGRLPRTVPVRLYLKDGDTGKRAELTVAAADEVDLGQPAGGSGLSFVAPLAVAQAASTLLRGSPSRQTAEMCLRIVLQERPKPIRFCNRYVGIGAGGVDGAANAISSAAASDMLEALALIDGYKFADLHVVEVSARMEIRRGARQAFLRKAILPKSVRPGQRVPVMLVVERVRGSEQRLKFQLAVPKNLAPGRRTLTLTGTDADTGDSDLFGTLTLELGDEEEEFAGGDPGPVTLAALARQIKGLKRYDGIGAHFGGRSSDEEEEGGGPAGKPVFRASDLRISGSLKVKVQVRKRKRG